MSNVSRFAPTGQALENVPHMLRYWADMIERDAENGIKIALAAVILVQENDPKPAFFIAGVPNGSDHPANVGEWVPFPREPTTEILLALSHALGIEPLGEDANEGYPITGQQSTVRQYGGAVHGVDRQADRGSSEARPHDPGG